MSISEEYERLKSFLATENGWQEIEHAWMVALNHEFRDGDWYKKSSSLGNQVAGLALDDSSELYVLGGVGKDHHLPRLDLVDLILKSTEKRMDYDEAAARVITGCAAYIEGWLFPLVQINGMISPQELGQLELRVLKSNIGLPIRSLLTQRQKEKRRKK